MPTGSSRNPFDNMRQPDQKVKLKEAFAVAKVSAEIEVYASNDGWCVPDMPADAQGPIYNVADAERAWGKLVALYKARPAWALSCRLSTEACSRALRRSSRRRRFV